MGIAFGQTATNPQTGHKIVLTPQGWTTLGSQQMQLPEADAKSMEALQQQAQDSQYLDQKGQQFIRAMDPTPGHGSFATGPGYGDVSVPHLADNINPTPTLVGRVDPRVADLQSITNQAWVHMRPQGSGAIRGYEASAFKEAFPGIEHWGPENQRIAARLHQDAQIATGKLQFIDNFIRSGQGDYAQANAAWAQGSGSQPGVPPQQPPAIPPPMQMVPNPQSPIGASPAPGVPPPPPNQQTPQQTAILNWTPDKGLQP